MEPSAQPGTNRQALLVIDLQQGIFENATPIHKADEMLDNINLLVERAHQAEVPVIYIQHSGKKSLIRGTKSWRFHPRIRPQRNDLLLHKTVGNAFEGTTLNKTLKGMNITSLVACGLVTHGCVRATCQGALKLGYNLTLAEDAHSIFSKQVQKVKDNLNEKMREKNAVVLPTSQISFRIYQIKPAR